MTTLNRKQRRAAKAQNKAYVSSQIQNMLASALDAHKVGDLSVAESIYLQTLQQDPKNSDALHLLGVIAYQTGHYEKSVALIGKAIEINPRVDSYHSNMGNSLISLGKVDSSIAYYKRALILNPDNLDAVNNIGAALHELGKWDEEIKYYEKALKKHPDNGMILNEAVKTKKDSCHWQNLEVYTDRLIKITKDSLSSNSLLPLTPYHSLTLAVEPSFKKEIAQNYARIKYGNIENKFTYKKTDKIKIGYVSADFRDHPTAHLIKGLYKSHDRREFEIYTYSIGPDDDSDYRKFFEENSDNFVDLQNITDEKAAELINHDNIDILVDVMGYIQNARPGIFAFCPAPFQVSYLAYPGTMGASFIPYLISDKIVIANESDYSEKIVYMPDSYFATDDEQQVASTPTRAECNLPDDKFIFCCFNKTSKIDEGIFKCWMEILGKRPDSALWLLSDNKFVQKNLRREAGKLSIDSERIIFASRLPKEQHLARHIHADLFLDCFTVNAHTTAIDALWAGLPVITKIGDHIISRASASILKAAGMNDLVVDSKEQYIDLALSLANDKNLLARTKADLQNNIKNTALFNSAAYAKNLEKCYREILSDGKR